MHKVRQSLLDLDGIWLDPNSNVIKEINKCKFRVKLKQSKIALIKLMFTLFTRSNCVTTRQTRVCDGIFENGKVDH